VGRAGCQGLYGKPRISRSLCWEDASITNEKVGNIMSAPKAVRDRGTGVFAHTSSSYEMSIARFLYNLFGAGCLQYFCRLLDAELCNLFVVLMQSEGYFCYSDPTPVSFVSQFDTIVFPGQNLAKHA